MDADFPIEYNTRHVEAFLKKIARHKDAELQKVTEQMEKEIGRIRQQGYAEARQLARRVIGETRERERRQRDRYLYKLRSDLTRERWGVLNEIRGRVSRDVHRRFAEAWADGERQWLWCRFWIDSAKAIAAPNDLQIYCGEGTAESVVDRIRRRLSDYPGKCEWHVDSGRSPGLIVEWPDHYLDGTLNHQCEVVVDKVLRRAADILVGEDQSTHDE